MTDRATGQCLCGAVRFACDLPLAAAAYCHCQDCRRTTGSAFNVSVPVARAAFHLTGTLGSFTKAADSGQPLTRHFCPACGSPVFTSAPGHPDRVFVKAGLFDDPALIRPAWQSWLSRAVGWARLPADLPGSARDRDDG